jgi:hypothetical protein
MEILMRIGTDLNPFAAPQTPDWQKVQGIFATGFIPDDWSNIKYTVNGDGIQPMNGKSFLSWQSGGGWQARAACGPWETPVVQGNFLIYQSNGGPIIVVPFVQTGS